MTKRFEGRTVCQCGEEYSWHGHYFSDNIFGKWEDIQKNCGIIYFLGQNKYSCHTICPKCQRENIIEQIE